MKKKLLVKKELFDRFKGLFTVYGKDTILVGEHEEKPLLIPKRFFGESGNIAIPMKIKYDPDFNCQAIMVLKSDYREMLSYFHVYEGEFNVPMLRKVFEFPAEHMPQNEKNEPFKLVCYLHEGDTCDEPKVKKEGSEGGYVIDL